jgi:hypothetical protein
MASYDSIDKRKLEEEVESSTARKRLRLSDDNGDDDDSSDSPEEEEGTEDEVSMEKSSMSQLNTSEEKLLAKRGHGVFFGDDTCLAIVKATHPRNTIQPCALRLQRQ